MSQKPPEQPKATQAEIEIIFNLETKEVNIMAPMNHPELVLDIMCRALQIITKKAVMDAREEIEPPRIIRPPSLVN